MPYLAGDAQVRSWFPAPGTTDAAIDTRARYLLNTGDWQRLDLAAIAGQAVEHLGGDATAENAARSLAEPGTVVIACGQQPAFGGGPFFNLVKTAHAIAIARRLTAAGIAAVPVYWCASEDHDQGETDHADLIDRHGRIERVRLAFSRPGASCRYQQVDYASLDTLQTTLTSINPQGLGRSWLADAAGCPTDLGTWAARLIQQAFAGHGLVVLQPHQLRPLWQSHWSQIVDAWPASALANRRQAIIEAEYTPAFADLSMPPIFADRPNSRDAIEPAGVSDVASDLLSAGAGLRPVLQQLALPVAAYVAGPGELAYHAEIGPVYDALGALAPVLLPRAHGRYLPAWWQRAARAWELALDDFLQPAAPTLDLPQRPELDRLHGEIDRLAATEERHQRALLDGQRRLKEEAERLERTLKRIDDRHRNRIPVGALHAWLHPRRQAQERVLSTAQVLFEAGPGIIDELVEQAMTVEANGMLTVPA